MPVIDDVVLEQFSLAIEKLAAQNVQPNGLTNAGSAARVFVSLKWNANPRTAARQWEGRVLHVDRMERKRVWQTKQPTPARAILRLTQKILDDEP